MTQEMERNERDWNDRLRSMQNELDRVKQDRATAQAKEERTRVDLDMLKTDIELRRASLEAEWKVEEQKMRGKVRELRSRERTLADMNRRQSIVISSLDKERSLLKDFIVRYEEESVFSLEENGFLLF